MPSQNHNAPSGPSVMSLGWPLDGIAKKVMIPVVGSSLTMELLFESPNQMKPSCVAAIPRGVKLHGCPPEQSGAKPVTQPLVVTRPMPSGKPDSSVNHSAPSAPATISTGAEDACGMTNSVMRPFGSMRPIWLATVSVNHMLPPG